LATKKQLAARRRFKAAAKRCKGKKARSFRACLRKALKKKK